MAPMVTAFDELKALLRFSGEPVSTGTPDEWAAAHRRLGRRFPVDYCQFVSTYGSCAVDNYYLRILNPFEEQGAFWQNVDRERAIDAEDFEACDPDDPRTLFPRPKGMIPWGSTDDGGSVLWLANSSDPDGWTVFEEWETSGSTFEGSMEEFLLASLRKERAGPSLGSDFPSSLPVYVDPVVPMADAAVNFEPDLLWDDATVATVCRVFPVASRRGESSLVMRPGGWMVSWSTNSFWLSFPVHDLRAAKEHVVDLVSALDVTITSVTPDSWSDVGRAS